MKKILLLSTFVLTVCCSCGTSTTNENDSFSDESSSVATTEAATEATTEVTTAQTTKAVITTKKVETTTAAIKKPQYFGGIQQQYKDNDHEHIILWQFYDDQREPIPCDAMLIIKIINDNGDEIFKDTFNVTSDNYSMWENRLTGKTQIMGSLSISDSDLQEGSSQRGTLSIVALVGNGGFDEQTINISNLPEKGVEVTLPDLPAVSNDYNYQGELRTSMTVSDISYEYNHSLKIHVNAQMTYNINGEDSRDYGRVGYKVTDESGMVIKSGDILYDKMSVGESQIDDIYISNAVPGDHYILYILDTE